MSRNRIELFLRRHDQIGLDTSVFIDEVEAESVLSHLCEEAIMGARKRIEYGQYIVADPEICHGTPTFKGTRIMVKSVLEMIAEGLDWDYISSEYFGEISREAISEAVQLARESLIKKTEKRRRAAGIDEIVRKDAYGCKNHARRDL